MANRRLLVCLVTGLSIGLSGCADYGELSFRQDKRLQVTAPADRSTVSLPVTVRWRMPDFTGRYALFVDRSPVPGGKGLDYVARHDRGCRDDPACPDTEYLASHQVFTTADTEFTFESLPAPSERDSHGPERHRVTIVLLDGDGHRIGESAWTVEFTLDREVP